MLDFEGGAFDLVPEPFDPAGGTLNLPEGIVDLIEEPLDFPLGPFFDIPFNSTFMESELSSFSSELNSFSSEVFPMESFRPGSKDDDSDELSLEESESVFK